MRLRIAAHVNMSRRMRCPLVWALMTLASCAPRPQLLVVVDTDARRSRRRC
jgi:hypothetical protein